MKIPGLGDKFSQQRGIIGEPAGDQVGDFALTLQSALHAQQAGGEQGSALFLGNITPDHDIDLPGFVFECDEDHAAGGAGSLAAADQSSHGHGSTAWRMPQVFGSGHFQFFFTGSDHSN